MEIWPNLFKIETVRLLGVDTPELKGSDRKRALAAQAFTDAWLKRSGFSIYACRRDAFGRLLGKVYRGDSDLATELIETDLARPR